MVTKIKQTLATTSVIALIAVGVLPALEPTIASAVTDQIIVTQIVDSGIAIDSPTDVTMSQNLGLTANTATGNVTWNVKTTNATGYTLDVHASSAPAMVSGANSFVDYTELVANTPETWTVTSAYEFGFSVYGADMTGGFGTDTDCVAGDAHTPSATLNWMGFNGATDVRIAQNTSATTQTGTNTTVCFASEQNTVSAPSGTYTATVTATAVVQ